MAREFQAGYRRVAYLAKSRPSRQRVTVDLVNWESKFVT